MGSTLNSGTCSGPFMIGAPYLVWDPKEGP